MSQIRTIDCICDEEKKEIHVSLNMYRSGEMRRDLGYLNDNGCCVVVMDQHRALVCFMFVYIEKTGSNS